MPLRLPDGLLGGNLRFRLAAWNTVIVLAMTIAALGAARYAARATLYDDADRELRSGVREVALALQDLFPDMNAVVQEMRRKAASHEERGWFMQLLTEHGEQVWRSEHCPDEVATFPPHNLDRQENIVQVGPYRYVRLRIARPDQPVFHVRVGTYTTGLDEGLSGMMRVLLAVGGGLCAITPLAGWWLAVRSTRPVTAILETAERLRPTRLGDRLAVTGIGDELDRLSQTINRLLDQVAAHVDGQERFLADAAHELRSPLTAMQSVLEVTLSQDRSPGEYHETLVDLLDSTRHLTKLANDLLLLAEYGDSSARHVREPVDLARAAGQAVGMFEGIAEERGLDLHLDARSRPRIGGDAARLRQVVGNLIDNALRHTQPGGRVAVKVADDGASGLVTVEDTGCGIAPEHLDRVFDRFWMINPARSHAESRRSGGLGLPICKSLVEGWGGSITLVSRVGVGTTVTVRLPLWTLVRNERESQAGVPTG